MRHGKALSAYVGGVTRKIKINRVIQKLKKKLKKKKKKNTATDLTDTPVPTPSPRLTSTQQERSFRPVVGRPGMGVALVTTEDAARERGA